MKRRLLLLLLLCPVLLFAQKLPSLEEKTTGLTRFPGFIDFYWDENNGKIWMDISKLDSEMLYVTSLPAGLGSNDIGLDRGLLDDTKIIRFQRVGRKILMVQPNYGFRATAGDAAERKAAEQSFASSTLWGFTLEAESRGHALVDATDFLLRDAVQAANRIRNMKQGNFILDKSRSAVYLPGSKNFPFNTELESSVTFVNNDGIVGNFVQSVTPSPDAFTLRMHHSFVQLPDTGYQPRAFDPRSSFIPISFYDYSSPVSEPVVKYLVMRHRLKKKDPLAARSEAVKPIVYYLDNGTPEPIRSALLEGARWWNQAFEAAGYIDAFQVKILPPDADPMDIRYNMINWVHRSTRGWSYGAAVVDPRTGEIIKGNVTLGSLRVRQDYLIAQGLLAPFGNGTPANDPMLQMALNRLKQLAAHEVGHTLGLMHNYAASASGDASVMDYPHPVIRLDASGAIDLSAAYSNGIGKWDKVAISWGYFDFPPGTDGTPVLNQFLNTAAAAGLQFISDKDARPRGGMHPTAHLWDNGSNATVALQSILKVREKALQQFSEANIRQGMPMAFLEDVLVPVYLLHRYQLEAAVKAVGGQNYTYALRGDGQVVTEAIPKAVQLQALQAVLDCIDPKVIRLPERIVQLIPPKPAGYASSRELFQKRTSPAFDVLGAAETAVDLPLSLLFVPERLNRLAAAGSEELGLGDMLQLVMEKTWKAPRRTGMEGKLQLQTEQVLLTYLLASSVDDQVSFAAKAYILKALSDLKTFVDAKKPGASGNYAGHLLLAGERMKAPEKAKPTVHLEPPPGAPIGCLLD